MPVIFGTKAQKAEQLDLIRKVLIEYLFNGLSTSQRGLILEHLEHMRQRPDPLNVSCKLETFPELLLTRITIDAAFRPKPPELMQ